MRKLIVLLLFLVFLVLSACGASRTYLVDINYVPQIPPTLKVEPTTVAVAPFMDGRSHGNDVGIRNKLDGSFDRYTTAPATVGEAIRKAVERFLRGNDLKTVNIETWDLRPESLSQMETDMVVGGEISRFWVQADSMAGRTIIKTDIELTIYVGMPREGKVLSQKMQLSREITHIIFSSEKLEEMLNESLSDVIESAFAELLTRSGIESPLLVFVMNEKTR